MTSLYILLAIGAFVAPVVAVPVGAFDGIRAQRHRKSKSRADVPASPCAPSEAKLSSLRLSNRSLKNELLGNGTHSGWSGLKFFLHEDGVFDVSDRVLCYRHALGTDNVLSNMDLKVLPNVAEHTTDVWALAQLRHHPGRIYDPAAADLHIIGSALGASFHAAQLPGKPCGHLRDHHRRVAAILDEIKNNTEFKRSGGRNWLFIDTDWNWNEVLTPEFDQVFRASHMLLATADQNISAFGRIAPQDTIVLPYKAHGLLDMPDPSFGSFIKLPQHRHFSFTFHGKMDRLGPGSIRPLLKNITEGLEGTSVEDVSFYGENPVLFADVTARTATTMQESTFCFVPAGDTASSRRLFDALAAGCVPIIFHQFEAAASNLPFAHSIDWTEIAFFAGGLGCLRDDVAGARDWLRKLWQQRGLEGVRRMQDLGRKVFLDVLSYRLGDVASAMLAEVGVKRQG